MDAEAIRVTAVRSFDFGGLPAAGQSTARLRRLADTTRYRGGTLVVRVHSADVASGSDGEIRVNVRAMGYTPEQPEDAFDGPVLATVAAAVDGTSAGECTAVGFPLRGGVVQVEVEGTQDSAQSGQTLEAALSIDLVLSDVEVPLVALRDGAFSRASNAWWARDDGRLAKKSHPGVLRAPERGRVVLEPAVTNLHNDSPTDISSAGGWAEQDVSGSYVVTPNAALAPDGSMTAAKHAFGNDANDRVTDASVGPYSGNTTYQLSVWARSETGTPSFRMTMNDGVFKSQTITLSPSWQRFSWQFTTQAMPTSNQVRYQQAGSDLGITVYLWGSMLQQDLVDLHPAPVLEAGLTKPLDDLSFATASLPPQILTEGFWFRFWPYYSDSEWVTYNVSGRFLMFTGGTEWLGQNNGTATFRYTAGGTNVNSSAKTWSRGQELVVVVDHQSAEVRFGGFTTGDETLDVSSAGDWSGAGATMQVGASTGLANPFIGEMSDLYPLNTAPI